MSPQEAAKIVGDEFHKFVDEMRSRGVQHDHVLVVVFNAAIRKLMQLGVKPKEVTKLLKDSLDVIRTQG